MTISKASIEGLARVDIEGEFLVGPYDVVPWIKMHAGEKVRITIEIVGKDEKEAM